MTSAMTYDSLTNDLQGYLDRNNSTLVAQIPNFITLGEIRCSREVKNLGLKTSVVSVMQAGTGVYIKPNRWLEVISMNFGNNTVYSVTYRQSATGYRTITLSSSHNFSVGDDINVFDVDGSAYNGAHKVEAVTQFTVSYTSGASTEALVASTGYVVGNLNNITPIIPRSLEYCNAYWPNRSEVSEPKFYADYDFNNWLIVPTPKIDYPFEVVFFQRPDPLSSTNQTNWFTMYARDLLLYACLLEAVPYLKNDQRISVWKDYYMQAAAAIKLENKERIDDASMKRNEQQ